MDLRVKRLRDVPLPAYGRDGDAALDLRACVEAKIVLAPGERAQIPAGVAVAIPAGYFGLIVPRSGLGSRGLHLANSSAVIDSNYRGEIIMNVVNTGVASIEIAPHDRIMQMAILPVARCVVAEVAELDETVRGDSGFGSSGV